MGGIAFVFSGQGDQYPGMGRTLYENYPIAKETFDAFDSIRSGTVRQCFEGTVEELQETTNTQPCLYAMELAAAKTLLSLGIRPRAAAGFSLGEVTACAFSGMLDERTGFQLVCRRGALMQEAAERYDTAMAAVVKLDAQTVRALCENHSAVYPVNFNCPGQVSVAGLRDRLADFSADVRAAGGRVLPIRVKGGFHSPFMNEAAQRFAETLSQTEFRESAVVLYSDKTGLPYTGHPAQLLAAQICSPVLWEELIRNMIADGIDTFIEIGPGKTLCGMIAKISTEVRVCSVCDLETVLSEVKQC